MKILILSFYFKPDLCAGSFRCSALVDQLQKYPDVKIDVMTTLPNRYSSFSSAALQFENHGNVNIHRISLPHHKSGMLDQAKSFYAYYFQVQKLIAGKEYDVIYATSSRLFSAFLGARIANKRNVPLYLDIRDIFVDTIQDVLPQKVSLFTKPIFSYIEKYTFASASRINLVSKGFKSYFIKRYPNVEYRWFTNGIDDEFLEQQPISTRQLVDPDYIVTILYAGNIGEGQGLHSILPQLAKSLEGKVRFKIIGDGGKKALLLDALKKHNVNNVELMPPITRALLIAEYQQADILFLHLNDYPAFEKVLPSKIFEYAALGKPILAGVNGYASNFLRSEVDNATVFFPGDHKGALKALGDLQLEYSERRTFKSKFTRTKIMTDMAKDIIDFAKSKGIKN